MGAPLDLTSRSPFRLRSARTLSTTLLGFDQQNNYFSMPLETCHFPTFSFVFDHAT